MHGSRTHSGFREYLTRLPTDLLKCVGSIGRQFSTIFIPKILVVPTVIISCSPVMLCLSNTTKQTAGGNPTGSLQTQAQGLQRTEKHDRIHGLHLKPILAILMADHVVINTQYRDFFCKSTLSSQTKSKVCFLLVQVQHWKAPQKAAVFKH